MRRATVITLLAVSIATIPFWIGSQYLLHIINVTGINMILALGLLFIFGYCGQLALCQAAFFGIGAYTTAILTTSGGLNTWIAMGAGMLMASIVGALVGLAILHLSGHYFVFGSFGFGEIMAQIFLNWKGVTGGTDGIRNIPKPSIGGWILSSGTNFYYLIMVVVLGLLVVAYRIRKSRYGRSFLAIRADALAAEVAGLDVFGIKWTAFVLSSAYAGVAGSLYAHLFSFISPDAFGFMVSVNVLAVVLIGGTAQLWGVLVGSAIVTILPEILRFSREYYMLIYGIGLAAVVVFFPGGVSGYRWRGFRRISDRH